MGLFDSVKLFTNTNYFFTPMSYGYASGGYSSYAPLFNFNSSNYSLGGVSGNSYSLSSTKAYNFDFLSSKKSNRASKSKASNRQFGNINSTKKHYDSEAANFVRTAGVSLNNIPSSFRNQYGVKEMVLADGRKVLACRWSRFNNAQKEWVDTLKYFEQAAADLGCDLVYSDVERTVAESNAGRAKKGNLVCKGGESPHNYGVAADFVLFKDGKEVNVNSDLQKSVVDRAIALSNNRIESGIYWRKQGERHHIELRGWRSEYKNSACLVG